MNYVVRQLSAIPAEADAALIVRHAEREAILPGTFGSEIPLTAGGVASAERLGAALHAMRPQVRAASSPVPRCLATAEAMLRGGGLLEEAAPDRRLGGPGAFIVDEDVSGALFLEIGILEIVRRQLAHAEPPAGMRATSEGVGALLGLTASGLGSCGRLNIYVTHDSILAALVAYLYRLSIDEIDWPYYLDGLLLWRSPGQVHFTWRGLQQASYPFGC